MYSEDYQSDLIGQHFAVFKQMATISEPYLTGSMVWNFADFATAQQPTRAFGNRKGLLTRDRQPKSAAYLVRKQYLLWRNQSIWDRTKQTGKKQYKNSNLKFDFEREIHIID